MSFYDKLYEKIQRDKKELAKLYNTYEHCVIYRGNNKYIVITKDGKEIYI